MGNLQNATKLADTDTAYNHYFVRILQWLQPHKMYWMISMSHYIITTVCPFEKPYSFRADGQSKPLVLCHLMILASNAYHTLNRT
jgi:hypothetical protein